MDICVDSESARFWIFSFEVGERVTNSRRHFGPARHTAPTDRAREEIGSTVFVSRAFTLLRLPSHLRASPLAASPLGSPERN